MSFLPDDYKKPEQGSKYLSPSKIEGEVKIRILTSAITGWLDWGEKDGKKFPIRTKEQPEKSVNPERAARHFWAFAIWNYNEECVQIMEIPQATIQDAITGMYNDEDWGDPQGYDIKIKKEGEKLKTKYTLTPSNKAEVSKEIKEAFEATNIDFGKYMEGENPFGETKEEVAEVVDEDKSLEELADAM